jgi:FtsH-binding integral membrane protein
MEKGEKKAWKNAKARKGVPVQPQLLSRLGIVLEEVEKMKEKTKELVFTVLIIAFIFGMLTLPIYFFIQHQNHISNLLTVCCTIIIAIVILNFMPR